MKWPKLHILIILRIIKSTEFNGMMILKAFFKNIICSIMDIFVNIPTFLYVGDNIGLGGVGFWTGKFYTSMVQ